jgi:tRNA threonylcarbamoyladenosine biosynthesis protein TsaB
MWLLSIDRSSPGAGAAVFRDGRLSGVRRDATGEPSRAPGWMADVAGLLAEQTIAPADLCALCAGMGPGSFSGIRSSLAALQGLALPSGATVFGVSSAAALAYRMLTEPDAPNRVAIVGDARRERFWVGSFRLAADGGVEAVGGDGRARAVSQTADDFELVRAGDVATAVPAGTRVASPDFGRIGAALNAAFGGERVVQTAVYPDAEAVGRLFLAAPGAARREPLPVYLHPAVAEKPAPAGGC